LIEGRKEGRREKTDRCEIKTTTKKHGVRRLKNDVNVRFGGRKEELIVHIEGIIIEEEGERERERERGRERKDRDFV
jgi:hypothetical protein